MSGRLHFSNNEIFDENGRKISEIYRKRLASLATLVGAALLESLIEFNTEKQRRLNYIIIKSNFVYFNKSLY